VVAERDSLREDLIHHRTSKRTVDKQWRIEREKSERLESELGFYQNHSARALADRDKVIISPNAAFSVTKYSACISFYDNQPQHTEPLFTPTSCESWMY
jgi:hypothetical protein